MRIILLISTFCLLQQWTNGQWATNFGQSRNFGLPSNSFGQSRNFGLPSNNFGSLGNSFTQPFSYNFVTQNPARLNNFQPFKPTYSGSPSYNSFGHNVPDSSSLAKIFRNTQFGSNNYNFGSFRQPQTSLSDLLKNSQPGISQPSMGNRLAADILKHAGSSSQRNCAKAVRQSIERVTGLQMAHTLHAKDYGKNLQAVGFKLIPNDSPLRPGDVRIINPPKGKDDGHMQMYTEQGWASDFKQSGEWPGSAYRNEKPSYTTYRLND